MCGRPGSDAQRADEFLVEHLHQRVGIGLARAAGGVDLTIGRLGVAPDPARIRPHRDQSFLFQAAICASRKVWVDLYAATRASMLANCRVRSEEHTSELQSLMRISYAVFCLKKKILFTFLIHIFIYYISYLVIIINSFSSSFSLLL